jgi:hypothetical protein
MAFSPFFLLFLPVLPSSVETHQLENAIFINWRFKFQPRVQTAQNKKSYKLESKRVVLYFKVFFFHLQVHHWHEKAV